MSCDVKKTGCSSTAAGCNATSRSIEPSSLSHLSSPTPSPVVLAKLAFFCYYRGMNLELITLLGVKVDQPVYEVMIPTADGEIAIFPDHEPLVGIAVPGAIAVRYAKGDADDALDYFAISGGVIEIAPDRVRVLVDEADFGDDIIEAESKAALDRAVAMRDSAQDQIELEKAHQLVDRHATRLKVAGLQRRRRTRP